MLTTRIEALAELDNAGLTERIRDLDLQARQVEAELAVVIAEGERRQMYLDDSHHPMNGWLKANANWPTIK